ncbi:hypothetical protein KJ969_01125 [Patescibacteria group bacterium]|nr:hypothetical protein [Patescibacteria group bacterium]MBU1922088.1 hypothetical protein [Patescibacteria group bacterium]
MEKETSKNIPEKEIKPIPEKEANQEVELLDHDPEFESLEQAQNEAEVLSEIIENSKEQTAEDGKQLAELRAELEIIAPVLEKTATEISLEEAQERLSKVVAKTKDMERAYLEIPEGEPDKEEPAEDSAEIIGGYEMDDEGKKTETDEEKRKFREKRAEEIISREVEMCLDSFKDFIRESKNGDKAGTLISAIIRNTLQKRAREYIGSGKRFEYHFRVTICVDSYTLPESGKNQYISKIEMENFLPDAKKAITGAEEKELAKAKKAGLLEEQDVG